MTVFRGRFDCKLDPKGRFYLPSAYKLAFSTKAKKEIVVTTNLYQGRKCLDVFTLKNWEKLEKRIASLPQLNSSVQAFRRFYMSSGQVLKVDSQSRITIPQSLSEYASLQGEIVLVGMGDKFELWSTPSWSELHSQMAMSFEQVVSDIANIEVEG